MLQGRPNTFAQTILSLSFFACDKAADHTFWLAAKYRSGMALDELRQAREMTQVHLAKILGVNQAAVSKMERRADMYVTTLQDFVKAMGGELKIIAQFPDRTVEIRQFEEVVK